MVGDDLCEAPHVYLGMVGGSGSSLKGIPGDLTVVAIRVKNCIIFPYR